ncbi:hypothetical protein B0T24DRAFT_672655 [Lasiosphaeria ovina]|uniref:Uncharacterized protein n=1 Tax=Lasiosphaeria ovina TaxID=92902 RepID=A0AAE0TX31_9PEZI|nr:hypothetical protein B0T24DRAFT_672655 [Lasiosphaeria ovina]
MVNLGNLVDPLTLLLNTTPAGSSLEDDTDMTGEAAGADTPAAEAPAAPAPEPAPFFDRASQRYRVVNEMPAGYPALAASRWA